MTAIISVYIGSSDSERVSSAHDSNIISTYESPGSGHVEEKYKLDAWWRHT